MLLLQSGRLTECSQGDYLIIIGTRNTLLGHDPYRATRARSGYSVGENWLTGDDARRTSKLWTATHHDLFNLTLHLHATASARFTLLTTLPI